MYAVCGGHYPSCVGLDLEVSKLYHGIAACQQPLADFSDSSSLIAWHRGFTPAVGADDIAGYRAVLPVRRAHWPLACQWTRKLVSSPCRLHGSPTPPQLRLRAAAVFLLPPIATGIGVVFYRISRPTIYSTHLDYFAYCQFYIESLASGQEHQASSFPKLVVLAK